MRKLVIHVGTHKTGSTSIQKTLSAHGRQLRQHGIAVLPDSRMTSLYRGFTDCPESCHQFYRGWHHKQNSEKVKATIKEHFSSSKQDLHIVSSEQLSLLSPRALAAMGNFLVDECQFEQLAIVCYLREPLSWLNSMLQQIIKKGVISLDELLNNNLEKFSLFGLPSFSGGVMEILTQSYFAIPQKLLQAFPDHDVRFIRFEEAIQTGLTATLLSQIMDNPPISKEDELRSNDGISHEACLLLAAMNCNQPLFHSGLQWNHRRDHMSHVINEYKKIPGGKANLVNPKFIDAKRIVTETQRINDLLGGEYFNTSSYSQKQIENFDLMLFSPVALEMIEQQTGALPFQYAGKPKLLDVAELHAINQRYLRRYTSVWHRLQSLFTSGIR